MKRYKILQYGVYSKYHIIDTTTDYSICICDTSEDAELIVKAMNALYKVSPLSKRTVNTTI